MGPEIELAGEHREATEDSRVLLAGALRIPADALASLDSEQVKTALAHIATITDDRRAAQDNMGIDQLTGTILGAAGHVVLQHAMNRSARTDEPLLLAMMVVEDAPMPSSGIHHATGDDAILGVARHLATTLRSYDAIVRYSHDELLCILDNAQIEDHAPRLDAVVAELFRQGYVVNVGFAQLQGGDTLDAFVSRSRKAASR